MKLLEKHLSTRISMGKRHCNLGIYWSKAGLLLVLAMYVCACGNRQRNGTPTQANDSIIVEVPQQVGVGSILPVTVTGESDFEIKKVQITGTFQNSSSRGYELRIWTAPKRDISVFPSQYQRHWGDTKEGILSTYDISNYYLYIKYLTADDELIACEMFSPYSNMSDLVNENVQIRNIILGRCRHILPENGVIRKVRWYICIQISICLSRVFTTLK